MFPRKETKESVAYCRFGSWTVPVRGLFFFFVLNGNRTLRVERLSVSTTYAIKDQPMSVSRVVFSCRHPLGRGCGTSGPQKKQERERVRNRRFRRENSSRQAQKEIITERIVGVSLRVWQRNRTSRWHTGGGLKSSTWVNPHT